MSSPTRPERSPCCRSSDNVRSHKGGLLMNRLAWSVLFVVVGCGGEGGGNDVTPREFCEQSFAALCATAYECLTPDQIALTPYGPTEAECVTNFQSLAM